MLVISKLFAKLFSLFKKAESNVARASFYSVRECNIHPSFKLGINNMVDISKDTLITIAEDVWINQNNFIAIKKGAKLTIGKNTYITRTTVACLDEITIGENCILGEGLKVFDHNHQYTTNPFKVEKALFNTAPIVIGNNCWTGANVTILKGVTIGNNVIIGSGCTIYKDIPDNMMVINKQELVLKAIV